MNGLDFSLSPALTRALGWTLLHSLWQGALVAAVLFGALLLLRHRAAALRYRAAAVALAAVVLLTLGTFGRYYFADGLVGASNTASVSVVNDRANEGQTGRTRVLAVAANAASTPATLTTAAASATAVPAAKTSGLAGDATGDLTVSAAPAARVLPPAAWLTNALLAFDRHLPLLVLAWGIGLLLMGLRLLGGLLLVQRLRRYRVQPLPEIWQARLAVLASRAGLRRPVQLLESALVMGPVVLGHLRPVVLLPLGAVAGLPPGYLEAILAHEVAHVLRRDYLVNLLLTVAETVFFYHPAVWFMSGCLRTERENCCDDLATQLVEGDALRLARALTALAEWTQTQALPALARTAPQLALAALGGRGSLLGRVRRLVVQHRPAPTRAEGALALVLLLGSLGLLGAGATVAGPLAGQAARGWHRFAKTVTTTTKTIATSLADTTRKSVAAPLNFRPGLASDAALETAAGLDQKAGNGIARPYLANSADGDTIRRRAANQRENPLEAASVVITKDKKGRVKELVVNGERIEAATDAKARTGRANQVLVVPMPPAPPRPPVPDFGAGSDPRSEREIERMSRRLERNAERMVVTSRGRRGEDVIRIDLNERVLGNLVNDALAISAASVNIGLEAASQGLREARVEINNSLRGEAGRRRAKVRIQESELNQKIAAEANEAARRDLRKQLQNPKLAAEKRRALEEAVRDLDETDRNIVEMKREAEADAREAEAETHQAELDSRQAEADSRQAEVDSRQADAVSRQAEADSRQADADSRRAEVDGRAENSGPAERRRELQNEIRRAEAELRRLKMEAGETVPPTPPVPPRAPHRQEPPAPPTPPPAPSATKLRDALRRDGLIGPKTTDFTFEIIGDKMKVDGKLLPAATAEKYRHLLTPANSKGHRSTFKMSVTENSNTTTH